MKQLRRIITPTLGQFLLVGVSGTLVNLGVLWLLVQAGMQPFWASLLATEISIINNFVWNDQWTFRGHAARKSSPLWQRFARFQVVTIGTAALTLALFSLFHNALGLHYLIAQGGAIGFATILNFTLNSRLTWGGKAAISQPVQNGETASATTEYALIGPGLVVVDMVGQEAE